jgi:hypothetical protein
VRDRGFGVLGFVEALDVTDNHGFSALAQNSVPQSVKSASNKIGRSKASILTLVLQLTQFTRQSFLLTQAFGDVL